MKTLRFYTLLSIATLLLAACGGGGGGDAEPVAPKTYTLEVSLPAEAGTRDVSTTQLSAAIQTVQSSDAWLTTTTQTGSVRLTWTDNPTTSQRKANVTVTSTTGDKLFINVTQEGRATDESGSTHGNTTDQPAYAPHR